MTEGVPLTERDEIDLTVTVAVPLTEVSTVEVAVIVALPAATPVTTPLETVTIELLLEDQVTFEEPVSTETPRVVVPPTAIDDDDGVTVIVFGAVV